LVPGELSVDSQPTVAGGRVLAGTQSGAVYALNAASGCVHWMFQAAAAVRAAVTVGRIETRSGARLAAFIGDRSGNVYAVDAASGGLPTAGSNQLHQSRRSRLRFRLAVHPRRLSNGRRAIVAGQKSGMVHALDPDRKGELIWQERVGNGGINGDVQWGSAADGSTMYVALWDIARIPVPNSR
jgi:outer membrane protein assembly factor BamB